MGNVLGILLTILRPHSYYNSGTGYGFMQAVQNLGLAVISMVAGMIVDSKGYLWLEVFFCAWLCVALLCTLLLLVDDLVNDGGLNISSKARRARAEAGK